jgi:hypothetical protein
MSNEINEKFYDPEDRANYWADTEPKTTKNLQQVMNDGITTKDEFDIFESSIKTWSDGDLNPEILDSWVWPLAN